MITKEEFEKAVNHCTEFTVNCKGCPLAEKNLMCGAYFAEYLKESEPALSANSTSSEILKNINSTHLDDSTKEQICQAYETADEACSCSATIDIGQN